MLLLQLGAALVATCAAVGAVNVAAAQDPGAIIAADAVTAEGKQCSFEKSALLVHMHMRGVVGDPAVDSHTNQNAGQQSC